MTSKCLRSFDATADSCTKRDSILGMAQLTRRHFSGLLLAGAQFPVPCGGTLVLDGNGNVLHYILNKSTEVRRSQLAAYLSYLVKRGQIGMPGQEQVAILAFRDDGRVRLQRIPALRHEERRPLPQTPTNA